MMKRSIITFTFLIFISGTVSSQILKKLKDISKKDVAELLKDEMVKRLEKSRNEYDAVDFNYAVSFSDNSGLYESEEKYRRYEKALLYILKPESLEDRTPEEKAEDYNEVGEMLYVSNRFRSAELSFKAAMLIYKLEGLEETKDAVLVTSNLGLLYHTTGRYYLSETFTREALNLRKEKLNDETGCGASMNNLAVLYKDMGRYNEAEDLILKAVDITGKTMGKNSSSYAIVLNNQALLYQVLGKYEDAEQLLLKSIGIAEKQFKEKSPNSVRLKVNLALLYQLMDRYDEAEKIYLEAIEIKKKRLGTGHPDYATLLRNIAALYMLKKESEKVEDYLNKAIKIYTKKFNDKHPSYAGAIYDLGRYYQYVDNTQKAFPLINQAIKIQKTALGEHHPSYVESMEALAILYWQTDEIRKAADTYRQVLNEYLYQINTYFPAMSEYDKSRFWEKIRPKFTRFNSFVVEVERVIPEISGDMFNYHIATKALLLNSTSKVKNRILKSGNPELVKKYHNWLDLKEYIARLYTFSKEELQADKINLDSLENKANLLEKELSKSSELFVRGYKQKIVTYGDISSKLNSNEAVIEILRFRKYNKLNPDTAVYYAALIVDYNKNSFPKLAVFTNGNELETIQVKEYRKAMQRGFEDKAFYEVYWNQLEELTMNANNLFVSLDGIYNQINLNTLKKRSGEYLIDEKNIFYVTNTKDVIGIKEKQEEKAPAFYGNKAILVGDPNYSKDMSWDEIKQMPLPELPGTKIEVEKIKEQLNTKDWEVEVFLKDEATEEHIKNIENTALLHIATHGFFLEDLEENTEEKVFGIEPLKASENPLLRSGLMFTGADNTIQQIGSGKNKDKDDGILNAYEAMIMNLDNTELVVLSACETGLGEIKNGEGVYGLQRAFQIAGASSVMISLWQVSDEVTQKLMTNFYKYWLQTGDKQEAFTRSQLEIKKKYPAPYYWGAFILVSR